MDGDFTPRSAARRWIDRLESRVGGWARAWARAAYDPFRTDGPSEPPPALTPFFRWSYGRMELPLLAMIACACTVGFAEVAIIDAVGRLVDGAATSGPAWFWADNAALVWWLLILVAVIRPLAVLGQGAIQSLVIGPGLFSTVIWRLHRHSLGQSLSFFEADFAGRLAQKEVQTAGAVDTVTIDGINAFGMLIAFLIGMTISLATIEPAFALIALVWLAGYALALYATLPRIRAAAKERADRRSAVSGQLVDSFSNIKTVKLFAHAGREGEQARGYLGRHYEASLTVGVNIMRLRLFLAALNALLMIAALGLPILYWQGGDAGLGALAASSMLAYRLTGMSNWIAFTLLGIFREIGAAEDGIETLSPRHEITDPPRPRDPASIASSEIRFEDVRFTYDGDLFETKAAATDASSKPPAGIGGVSLTIAPGEKVGLVGPSGAGKSTLVSLLLRLHEIDDGRIALGGVNVTELTQDALRRRIAVVTQETAIFNRSALDNILYGRPDATLEQAKTAALRARAAEFIEDLVDRSGRRGYAAQLGERGVRLSGGQRQRLALARAFLKDAPVLVLDEATSALDSEIEAEILAALPRLMRGKTVLAIAHRLSTLAEMDRIVVMSGGRIVEQGTHLALLDADGLYARLWSRQSGGFLPDRLEAT